jgi:hypothetical protein
MSTPPDYWDLVRAKAKELNSDGCTVVADIYVDCCFEHDLAYRTGLTVYGDPITRKEADVRFRKCIQSHSKLGKFSPLSWVRYAGVRLGRLFGIPYNKG